MPMTLLKLKLKQKTNLKAQMTALRRQKIIPEAQTIHHQVIHLAADQKAPAATLEAAKPRFYFSFLLSKIPTTPKIMITISTIIKIISSFSFSITIFILPFSLNLVTASLHFHKQTFLAQRGLIWQ